MLFAALGVVAIALGGGTGTFASFNAEVTNGGNYFATGTLFLHQQEQAGDICRSEDGTGNSNSFECGALLTADQLGPGSDPATIKVAMTNGGSIDASTFNLAATCTGDRPVIAQAATYTTVAANAQTTLTLSGLNQALVAGTDLLVGGHTFQVVTGVASGATSVDVKNTGASTSGTGPLDVQVDVFGGDDFCSQDVDFTIQRTTDDTYDSGTATCVYPATNCTTTPGTLGDFVTNEATAGSLSGLTAGQTKYYLVTLSLNPSVDNAAQNAEAKFDLDWTIAQ
jgi:predicted ribosomally synthesized peptide with SipW-like signal peptide